MPATAAWLASAEALINRGIDASAQAGALARRLQGLGLTLDEVISALHANDEGQASCETQRWRLEAVLDRIEARIAELARLRAEVHEVLAACDAGSCTLTDPRAGDSAADHRPPSRD